MALESQSCGDPRLPLARYRLRFVATGTVRLPHFAGSTWRGALGHALKKLVCVTHLPECGSCALVNVCSYAYLFETPPPRDAEKMRKYPSVPHPFVLNPHVGISVVAPGDAYELPLTLIGAGNRQLPYLVHALERAAHAGVGAGRERMELVAVEQETWPGSEEWEGVYQPGRPISPRPISALSIPSVPRRAVLIECVTPLRLRRQGRPVRPDQLRFSDLFSNLLRRVSMLTYFHTEVPLQTDFAGLTARAKSVEFLSRNLEWRVWDRYSSRQKAPVAMDGLLGAVVVPAEGLAAFWPYLWLGQFVHAGAGTSMGQGRLTLRIS